MEPAQRTAARVGARRHAALEGPVEQAVVRHPALLRLPREQGLQDAHPRTAVEVPKLHAVHGVRRRTPETRCAAVAHRLEGRWRCGAPPGTALHAGGRAVVARTIGGAAGLVAARPDAAADSAAAIVLRAADRR